MRHSVLADTIVEEMLERDWALSDVASRMGGDYGLDYLALHMYLVVDDENCFLGDEMAERLGKAFDVSPELFTNLEKQSRELRKAQ